MANLTEAADTYAAGVYQLEETDDVIGGPGGISNEQAQNLADRTKWLKTRVDAGMRFPTINVYPTGGTAGLAAGDLAGNLHQVTLSGGNGIFNLAQLSGLNGHVNAHFIGLWNGSYLTSGAKSITINAFAGDLIIDLDGGPGGASVVLAPNVLAKIYKIAAGTWGLYRVTDKTATPPGAVMPFAAATPAYGWLACNGAAISRTAYAQLFATIGTTFGVGDGATTFNVPDLRGEFIRGFDDGRGIDVARAFGSAQSEMVGPHVHTVQTVDVPGAGTGEFGVDGASATGFDTLSNGGTENRPRNIALLYCIKY
jgi:hypothetical protein